MGTFWKILDKFFNKIFSSIFCPCQNYEYCLIIRRAWSAPQLPNAPPPVTILEDLFLLLASARPKEGASPELARWSADRNIHSRRLDASDVVAYLLTPVCGVAEFPFTYDNSSCTKVKWHGQLWCGAGRIQTNLFQNCLPKNFHNFL